MLNGGGLPAASAPALLAVLSGDIKYRTICMLNGGGLLLHPLPLCLLCCPD
jgi:hypothetical protein